MYIEIESIDEFKEVPTNIFNVKQINSIKSLYGEVRDKSKVPTFPFDLWRY